MDDPSAALVYKGIAFLRFKAQNLHRLLHYQVRPVSESSKTALQIRRSSSDFRRREGSDIWFGLFGQFKKWIRLILNSIL